MIHKLKQHQGWIAGTTESTHLAVFSFTVFYLHCPAFPSGSRTTLTEFSLVDLKICTRVLVQCREDCERGPIKHFDRQNLVEAFCKIVLGWKDGGLSQDYWGRGKHVGQKKIFGQY